MCAWVTWLLWLLATLGTFTLFILVIVVYVLWSHIVVLISIHQWWARPNNFWYDYCWFWCFFSWISIQVFYGFFCSVICLFLINLFESFIYSRYTSFFLFICFILLYFFITIYPPSTLPPPLTPSPSTATLLSASMSSFSFFLFFLLDPSLPTALHRAVSLLSIYESVSVLLVSSVCSLDSTNEWNHMARLSLTGKFHLAWYISYRYCISLCKLPFQLVAS